MCESIKTTFPWQAGLGPTHAGTFSVPGTELRWPLRHSLRTVSQCKTSLVNRPAHTLYPLNTPSSVIAMIPEAGLTLDSILEGILSERESEEEGGGEQLDSDLRQSTDRLFSYSGYSPVQIKYELDSSPDNSQSSPASVFSNPVFPKFVKIGSNGSILNIVTENPESEDSLEQCLYSVKTEVPDSCTGDAFAVCNSFYIQELPGLLPLFLKGFWLSFF